ncbi:hypothetical protein [Listeria booriae]|uniref:hypothetical protein n=1 Tax=Listeria booriae TaxID=1552123 RepID=UPI001624C09F|nr:hypothetical protein [Listeria booriae]MBC2149536.1 hypothetical protein [Listeria booriae]
MKRLLCGSLLALTVFLAACSASDISATPAEKEEIKLEMESSFSTNAEGVAIVKGKTNKDASVSLGILNKVDVSPDGSFEKEVTLKSDKAVTKELTVKLDGEKVKKEITILPSSEYAENIQKGSEDDTQDKSADVAEKEVKSVEETFKDSVSQKVKLAKETTVNGQFGIKPYTANITMTSLGGFTNKSAARNYLLNVKEAISAVKAIDFSDYSNVRINVKYPFVDSYGNEDLAYVIKTSFSKDTLDKINTDNLLVKNIPTIADEFWSHPTVTANLPQ